MDNIQTQIQKILDSLIIDAPKENDNEEKMMPKKNQDQKKIKKKLKKSLVQENDSLEKAYSKMNKILQEIYKNYQWTCKSQDRIQQLKEKLVQYKVERDKTLNQKKIIEQLYNNFKKKYEEQLKIAQSIEKQEEQKTQAVINELQNRIKTIQSQYEESGKKKIDKYRESQMLKHQTMKLQPHLMASQSLYDAQLNKKSIEIEIGMTTLKQKIQMMDNFKEMKTNTSQKLKNSKEIQEKIQNKLKKLEQKQQQHKLEMAKAHMVLQQYKKAIEFLRDALPKKQKQVYLLRQKKAKNEKSLQQIKQKIKDLQAQHNNQCKQLDVLKVLKSNLQKELNQK